MTVTEGETIDVGVGEIETELVDGKTVEVGIEVTVSLTDGLAGETDGLSNDEEFISTVVLGKIVGLGDNEEVGVSETLGEPVELKDCVAEELDVTG